MVVAPVQPEVRLQLSTQRKAINFAGVVVPFIGLIVGMWAAWADGVFNLADVVLLLGLYFVTMFGIVVGFHRLLTHRAFETFPWVRYVLAVLGSLGVEGPVIRWVADHRKHHALADHDGDPHSPQTFRGPGFFGALRGLWHAHAGWLFTSVGLSDQHRFARDLVEDRGMRMISRTFIGWTLLTLLLPFAIGWAWTGTLRGGLWAFVWGGLVRIFLVHHVTWSVNSLGHFIGPRRFETSDESRNLWLLALPTLGDAYHNNHHAFPRSAFHGMRWWQFDPAGLVIRGMESVGLVWNVVRIDRARQANYTARQMRPVPH